MVKTSNIVRFKWMESLQVVLLSLETLEKGQQGGGVAIARDSKGSRITQQTNLVLGAQEVKRLAKLLQACRGVVGSVESSQILVDLVEAVCADISNGVRLLRESTGVHGSQLLAGLDTKGNPPSGLILTGLGITSGQESALADADLTRFLGDGDNGETDLPNPGVLLIYSQVCWHRIEKY
jgi:hypothetical protein